jgi:hypothetical protein
MNFVRSVFLKSSLLRLFTISSAALFLRDAHALTTTVSAGDFMKIRCNAAGKSTLTTWQGNVTTTGIGADKSRTLFKIAGFNIARCLKNDADDWVVTSREMTFYLDPQSGEVLKNWLNPWTNETVPVVHIANALVQQKISGDANLGAESAGETSLLRIDVPLSYPNPLGQDSRFSDYAPENTYKAHESFTYVFSRKDLAALGQLDAVSGVQVSWTRVSPWLPWMKMKGATGHLVFNALVTKLEDNASLPEFFKNEIFRSKTELYFDAPRCIVKNRPNVSSWTYFKDNFEAYVTQAEFPRPEPATLAAGECTGE